MLDDILGRLGLTYEELTNDERNTLDVMLKGMSTKALTVEEIKQFIKSMRESIETELIKEPEFHYILIFKVPNRNQIFLKARLKNCMILEAFLTSPDRAKQALESALSNIQKAKKI